MRMTWCSLKWLCAWCDTRHRFRGWVTSTWRLLRWRELNRILKDRRWWIFWRRSLIWFMAHICVLGRVFIIQANHHPITTMLSLLRAPLDWIINSIMMIYSRILPILETIRILRVFMQKPGKLHNKISSKWSSFTLE